MGATNRSRTQELTTTQDLLPLFAGFGAHTPIHAGAELEIFLMRRAADGFSRLSDDDNRRLFTALRGQSGPATPVSEEPEASQIETQSRPHVLTAIHRVVGDIATHRAAILHHAQNMESGAAPSAAQTRLVACPFAVMPFSPARDALVNIIGPRGTGPAYSDRPRVMVQTFSQTMSREAALYPVANTAVHFTHGARDLRHAFEMSRLQAALLPFFFIITENRPPYGGDDERRIDHHTGLRVHMALNTLTARNHTRRGLVPDFLFAAQDEHDFLFRMIETALDTQMLAYYDHRGRFTPAPSDAPITPRSMRGLGPQNVAQFELALSTFWWSFKYKLPRDGGGLLHELRDFDSGPEVVANIALIGGMLALDDAARAEMIARLEHKYGLPLMTAPETARRVIRQNLYGAYHRGNPRVHPGAGGDHMGVPFGARGHTMRDFLRGDLLPMLEAQYRGTPAAALLDNLRYLAAGGRPNAQLWSALFNSRAQMHRAVLDLTAPGTPYDRLARQPKSWAQHYDEGNLPMLRPGG